ncbi:phosphoglycolate phosphatase, partial [Salmonella enterica subsp. enterica serovar Mississippi]|nr:phosphoglycolate phosphatase [Salmonella enterica subsp. enterica serovar Mississippi]
ESIALSEPDLVLHQFTGLLPALGIDR